MAKLPKMIAFSFLLIIFAMLFAVCDAPMGMGPLIDTVAPVVAITNPQNGKYIRGILLGMPITINGTVSDDIGVNSLQIEIYNRTSSETVTPEKLYYEINPDGTWWAEILLDNPGTADYRITVTATDSFNNKGASSVDVRIDIIPPWVKEKKILRHPNGFKFEADLFSKEYYRGLNIIEGSGSYNDIVLANMDQFQNEEFTLKIQIDPAFSDVAASMLFVYDTDENPLNEIGLLPDNDVVGEPEWTITKEMMEGWDSRYKTGSHYISFEVRAWSEAAWDPALQKPIEGEAEQFQKIEGTCWFPESDMPHIYINSGELFGNTITLNPDSLNALTVEFFDDDRLGGIYAGILPEDVFNGLRGDDESEEDYLRSLMTDTAKRDAAIALITKKSISADLTKDNRWDTLTLGTGIQGEYRLIALANDAKPTGGNYSFTDGEKWNVYPYRRILVQAASAPVIIVENPSSENQFPDLRPSGDSFNLSGYAISISKNSYVQIAWLPNTVPDLEISAAHTALRQAQTEGLAPGGVREFDNGIKVWNLQIGDPEITGINGTEYLKTGFNKAYNIANDFIYKGKNQGNESKRLVIHSNNGADAFKTFRLAQWTTGPAVEATSHGLGAVHDLNNELVLKMRLNPGSKGIKINQASIKISDITDNKEAENESYFSGKLFNAGDEYQRVVPKNKASTFPEGSSRKYCFYAEDILGNSTTLERSITMSNLPVLDNITCTDGSGSYGIDRKLSFEVSFTMPVRVTGNPQLKLFFTDPGDNKNATAAVFATRQSTAAGNTVVFTYTVKDGDSADKLYTSLDPIDLNGGTFIPTNEAGPPILTFSIHGKSLQNNEDVKLDGVRPKVVRASFVQVTENAFGGATYFTSGKTVTLKLQMSEPVRVSGSPVAKINGSGLSALNAEFSRSDTNDASILYFTTSQISVGSIASSQLLWGPVNVSGSVEADFISTNTTNTITDALGNLIDLRSAAIPNNNNRYGNADGVYSNERAFIDTVAPNAPAISIHSSQADARNNLSPINGSVLSNTAVYLRVAGTENGSSISYSLQGGSDPQSYNSASPPPIADSDSGNKDKSSYKPSVYSVTAWQTDAAGNQSPLAGERQVTINSRAAELRDIDIALPDGTYPAGTLVTFKLNFSGKVRPEAGAAVTFAIRGTNTGATDSYTVNTSNSDAYIAADDFNSMLNVNWTVPSGIRMKNIKASSVTFTNIVDEYGNTLKEYSGSNAEDGSRRPLTINIDRLNLEINSIGPKITGANPVLPTASGEYSNGREINGNSFTLTFDIPVTKVAGKYITVRPYGQWAIPPVLSPDEFQSFYNAAVSEEHRKILKNVDIYGVPISDSIRGNSNAYNSYIENTHGVTDIGGFVRPDTSAKWVLAFDIDPYQTDSSGDRTAKIREVFNAVQWKWQRIPVSQVTIDSAGTTVTVTLNEALQKGRIWEVLIDDGAFQDMAGNPSAAIVSNPANSSEQSYRFWSSGTETPVIRVDKITYDGRLSYTLPANNARRQANINLGFINAGATAQEIPPIDTKVRIDCETPGAAIRYDVIRTSFNFAAATGAVVGGLNPVLGGTTGYTTDADFFGSNLSISPDTGQGVGYQRNSIGNEERNAAANLTNGFFNKLLVPNSATGGVSLTNGTFAISALTTLQNTIRNSANFSGGTSYTNSFIFIGEAFGTLTNTVSSHTDSKLYSGRRDYIAAVAKKDSVASGNSAGPALVVSALDNAKPYAGMEGVYKTTFIYRSPSTTAYRLLLDGRTEVIYDGSPIPGFGMDDLNPSADDRYESIAFKTFYRIGGNLSVNPGTAGNESTRNHILVSWEFVADIKRNRPAYYTVAGSGTSAWGSAVGTNANGGFTSAPYGGVLYRYGGW